MSAAASQKEKKKNTSGLKLLFLLGWTLSIEEPLGRSQSKTNDDLASELEIRHACLSWQILASHVTKNKFSNLFEH